jgi:lipoate-protein ligase A
MHDVIRTALESAGVTAACTGREESGRGAFLCFQHHTPGDVLLDTHKVIGSAQRRRAGGLLQHGSILLAASPFASELRGIRELLGVVIAPDRLAGDVAGTFARLTGWTLEPAEWSRGLIARRAEIARTRFADPGWTERR